MKQSIYIFKSGTLKRDDNNLLFIDEQNNKKYIPIEIINDLYIFSEMDLNAKLLVFLSQKEIPVHFFNYYEYYSGSFMPRDGYVSGDLLIKQVEHYTNMDRRLIIAKEFIKAASYNIYRNLRYYNNRGKDLDCIITQIQILRESIDNTRSINELMGIEGNIRKVYYSSWNIINENMCFEKRVKRPPDNIINTLISFLNSIFYTKVLTEIYKTQLNPTISYLHEPGTKRFSLSLDVSEVFKPLIVDRLIFNLINKNVIKDNDFYNELNYLRLKEDSLKKIMVHFEETMKRTINHKTLNRNVSYQHLIRLELYKLIKHLLGEKNYEGFKIWW